MRKVLTVLLIVIIVFSMTIFVACEKKDALSCNEKEKLKNIKLSDCKDKYINLDVYYRSSKGEEDTEIIKEEKLIEKEEMLGQIIMQEIIKGPSIKSNLAPVLPKETRLLAFSIKDEIAYVNLSKEAQVPMSPVQELACLKSIASSLSQLPTIKKIQIQIENHNIDSLGGNYDIEKPFNKDDIDARKK